MKEPSGATDSKMHFKSSFTKYFSISAISSDIYLVHHSSFSGYAFLNSDRTFMRIIGSPKEIEGSVSWFIFGMRIPSVFLM